MRHPRKLHPSVETMESKLLMSADGLASAVLAPHVSQPIPPFAVVVPLDGGLSGTYTIARSIPDTGTTYELSGSGRVHPLGQVSLIDPSDLHSVGFVKTGKATGVLTLSDGKGDTLTLDLTAEKAQPSFSKLPTRFDYVVEKGTGKFLHDYDTGEVTVKLTPSKSAGVVAQGKFAITIESSHIVPLDGDLSGTYTIPHVTPDAGTTYDLSGSGRVHPLGQVSLVDPSDLHSVGFVKTGKATGILTLSDGKGDTLTLDLTAEKAQPGFSKLPTRFDYVVEKGTGKFSTDYDTGEVTVKLSPSKTKATQGKFEIEIESSHSGTFAD